VRYSCNVLGINCCNNSADRDCCTHRLAHVGSLAQLLKAELKLSLWEIKGPEDLCQVIVILWHTSAETGATVSLSTGTKSHLQTHKRIKAQLLKRSNAQGTYGESDHSC